MTDPTSKRSAFDATLARLAQKADVVESRVPAFTGLLSPAGAPSANEQIETNVPTVAHSCESLRRWAQQLAKGSDGESVQFGPVTFGADRESIVRPRNEAYTEAELAWCHSRSTRVDDLEDIYSALTGKEQILKVWRRVTGPTGLTLSNHGHTCWLWRGNQENNVVNELLAYPASRRAVILYASPTVMAGRSKYGGSDQPCTMYCHVYIAAHRLVYHVYMRALDLALGYPADFAWHHELVTAHLLPRLREGLAQNRKFHVNREPVMLCTAGIATVYKPLIPALLKDYKAPLFDLREQNCRYRLKRS